MATADDILRAARYLVNQAHPYLGPALWALRLEASETCPTLGVSAEWTCYYNPERVATWPAKATTTVLIHEIWHLLRDHHTRAKVAGVNESTAMIWNLAGDEEINDNLVEKQMPFPPDIIPVTPKTFQHPDDLLAEEYYAKLLKDAKKCTVTCFGGSAADGLRRPWESGGAGPPSKNGQASNGRVIPEELIRRSVAEAIGREAGDVPGNWKRWAGVVTKVHVIPWQQIFRQVIGTIISAGRRDEYTYARPARREIGRSSYIWPGSYGTLPDVVICVDTSGSMGQSDLAEAIAIVESILEHMGRIAPIQVIAGDTCVQATSRTLTGKNVTLQGGGGTDMGVLLAHAETLKPRPQVVVLVTDGYTPWPGSAPVGMQTVVVLTQPNEVPKWATVVRSYAGREDS